MHSAKLVAQTVPTINNPNPEQFVAYVARSAWDALVDAYPTIEGCLEVDR